VLGAQVTFRSQELQARGICDAIAELGFGAEIKETRSAQQERCVARLQVLALPFAYGCDKCKWLVEASKALL